MASRKNTFSLLVSLAFVLMLASLGCRQSPEQKAAKAFARGASYYAAKDYRRAVIEFSNATQAQPGNAEAHYQLGLAYIAARNYRDGVAALRRATELKPTHAEAQLKLSELMSVGGDEKLLQDAEARLNGLLAADPKNLEAITSLVVAELRLGKEADASRRLEETLEKFPSHLRSAVTLARLKLAQKDWPAAEEVLKRVFETEPRSSPAALCLGQFYAVTGKPDLAEQYTRLALEIDPTNTLALLNLGALQVAGKRMPEADKTYAQIAALPDKRYKHLHAAFLFHAGRRQQAVGEFERLANADLNDRVARNRLTAAYLAMKQPAEAERVLNAALKRDSKDVSALALRAQMHLGYGRFEEAERDAREVLRLEPSSAYAHFTLASVEGHRGRPVLERHELGEAVRLDRNLLVARTRLAELLMTADPKSARDLMNEAPPAQRQSLPVITVRNWALAVLGEKEALRKGLREGFALASTPDLVLQDGYLKLSEGQYSAAQTTAETVLKRNELDIRAVQLLGRVYAAQKQIPMAARRIAEIAARHPKSVPLQTLLGHWQLRAGNRAEARKAFLIARAADPTALAVNLALAELDIAEQKLDSARKILTEARNADPRDTTVLLRLAHVHDLSGNRNEAITLYRAVLDIDPKDALALNNLAYHLASDSPDEALKYAQRAIERDSQNPVFQDTIGWVYFRRGMYAPAARYLKTAVARDPAPRHRFHLAVLYLKTGELTLGQELMASALRDDPNLLKTERF